MILHFDSTSYFLSGLDQCRRS